jgi:hypothetical protein
VLPGIVLAALHFKDDEKLGAEVRKILEKGGLIKKGMDGEYEAY